MQDPLNWINHLPKEELKKYPEFRKMTLEFEGIAYHGLLWRKHLIHGSFSLSAHRSAQNWLVDHNGHVSRASVAEFARYQADCMGVLSGETILRPISAGSVFFDRGTSFQKKVWKVIASIPHGETKTYGQIAHLVGKPSASRAVGQACGANPLALFLPCHRVVGATSMGGFSGGPDIKARLLDMEQRIRKYGDPLGKHPMLIKVSA